MGVFLEELSSGRVLVSDGAWGTLLVAKGLAPGACPELWNSERPEAVLEIARSYVEAGADTIETNSFGGSRFKLAHYGLADRAAELNEKAAAISRQAAGSDHFVLASVGPTGKILMMGDVSEGDLYDAFREQAQALERGGADVICIETMTALDEALIAIRAVRENTSLPVACTFSFDRVGEEEYRTMMGLSPCEMAEALIEAGADIIGTNCGQGPEGMIEIVAQIRAVAPDTPILVHANAGLPAQVDGKDTYPETPEVMADRIPALIQAGANIVGGCCGTTPAHIRAIRAAVDKEARASRP